jgi:hypothetical protein
MQVVPHFGVVARADRTLAATSRLRRAIPWRATGIALLTALGLALVSTPAWGLVPTSFTPGDLVIYETQGTSTASSAVNLVDYSTSGTPSGYSVALPTADSGSVHALTESGSALNDGELTLSADGQSLVATGYDAAPGVAGITSAASTPRTVALVSAGGAVDTSTSLTDAATETQNFRSATTAVTGGNIYVGSGSGTGITTDGTSTATYLTPDKVHEVQDRGCRRAGRRPRRRCSAGPTCRPISARISSPW